MDPLKLPRKNLKLKKGKLNRRKEKKELSHKNLIPFTHYKARHKVANIIASET